MLAGGRAGGRGAGGARRPAGATSSASSKLIHGGLRYLQMGDIRLVREAHAERHALARVVAPHLVRPRAFLVPVYRGGPVRATKLRAGLVLYGGLGRFEDGGGSLLRPPAARTLVPCLRTTGLRSAGR
jgi:glycerol-3-phosphate dehydrogenase